MFSQLTILFMSRYLGNLEIGIGCQKLRSLSLGPLGNILVRLVILLLLSYVLTAM